MAVGPLKGCEKVLALARELCIHQRLLYKWRELRLQVARLKRLEVRRVHTAVQVVFAFSDALAKVLFTCLPEPAAEVYAEAAVRAQ